MCPLGLTPVTGLTLNPLTLNPKPANVPRAGRFNYQWGMGHCLIPKSSGHSVLYIRYTYTHSYTAMHSIYAYIKCAPRRPTPLPVRYGPLSDPQVRRRALYHRHRHISTCIEVFDVYASYICIYRMWSDSTASEIWATVWSPARRRALFPTHTCRGILQICMCDIYTSMCPVLADSTASEAWATVWSPNAAAYIMLCPSIYICRSRAIYLSISISIYVYVYVCIYVYIYIYTYTYIHISIYIHIYISTHINVYIHISKWARYRAPSYIYIYV